MPVKEISQKTGLTVKRVRKTLKELYESNALRFWTLSNYTAHDAIWFWHRLIFDESEVDAETVTQWHLKHFAPVWHFGYRVMEHPVIYTAYMVNSIHDIKRMTDRVKQEHFTKIVKPLIFYAFRLYPGLCNIWLEELIAQAGY